MDVQQLATKVAQLEARVATLEDEGKIVKGEVKQVLTEIRSAILVRENPFDGDGASTISRPTTVTIAPAEQAAKVELVMAQAAPQAAPPPEPKHEPTPPSPAPQAAPQGHSEPFLLHPQASGPAPRQLAAPQHQQADWSLLTIAGLSAWAEDAVRRVGSLRLEILLDLCEAAGHLTSEARTALARVTELDLSEPEQRPSTNETVVILRELDALVNDDESDAFARAARRL